MSAAKVRDHANDLRGLLAGHDVAHRHAGRDTVIRMVNDDHIRNNAENPVPVYMAAEGDRAFEVAGDTADGWVTTLALQGASTMGNAPEVFKRSLTAVQESATRAGRTFYDAYTIWTTALCVLEPGESAISPRALAQTGPMATFAFHNYACNPEIGPFLAPELRERLDIYEKEVLARLPVSRERFYQAAHAGHLSHLLDGEAAVLTEEIVRMTTLTGTAEEIAAVLGPMEGMGLKNVTLWIPPTAFRDVVLDVETKLLPLLG